MMSFPVGIGGSGEITSTRTGGCSQENGNLLITMVDDYCGTIVRMKKLIKYNN